MSTKEKKNYYLGLDIGTDSVGYAAADKEYKLCKFRGQPMWGVHVFENANECADRRGFRSARRRLDRRQQRARLIQEIFAKEIAKVDVNFYTRIKESHLFPEDAQFSVSLFDDADYKDSVYYGKENYPTIHHLICELMNNNEPHDVRFVYLACAYLVAHRGHFLKEISVDKIEELTDINSVYCDFINFFEEAKPWGEIDVNKFGELLKEKVNKGAKYKNLCQFLYGENKAQKEVTEDFPYSKEGIIKLLCGSTYSVKDLFGKAEYEDIEKKSISLGMKDEDFQSVLGELGDDGEIVIQLKNLYDWTVLCDVLKGHTYISEAKVEVYKKHESDLKLLKELVKKYIPEKYDEMFRQSKKGLNNYVAYSKNFKSVKKGDYYTCNSIEEFNKYVNKLFCDVTPDEQDAECIQKILLETELCEFMPKQVNGDNRVIPYQVYFAELRKILDNAQAYLPFLNEADEDGYTNIEKILSVFKFRVPYFVGPLNKTSEKDIAWMKRKAEGRIYPWNFEEKVDLDESEQAFIDRMTNTCTYLPGEDVLPKMSLCHEKFQVLNEINVIQINGRRLPVEVKQEIYNELFMKHKKVSPKKIKEYLKNHNYCTNEDLETFAGLDQTVKSSLSMHIAFSSLMQRDLLSEADVERIIERKTYCEDNQRFKRFLDNDYPNLSKEDKKYISRLKIQNFARLSRALLCELEIMDRQTGEVGTVSDFMWNYNYNLMELQTDKFDLIEKIAELQKEYYAKEKKTLSDRLDDMYVSNSVKRAIIRTLDIVRDVVKANGKAPEKIFIEMARGGKEDEKGKRTKSRYEQLKALYENIKTEDARLMQKELDALGENKDRILQSERYFLYFIQMGKCMYSGLPINLSEISEKTYDVDHIYPQSKVKDDSVLNNKVLVLSERNREKGDKYPVPASFREKMQGMWKIMLKNGQITDEKYYRLTRIKPFSEDEQWGFINRQLVETRQSTKVIKTLLEENYPETKIVCVKANLASDFRQEFDLLKSRAVNDLHHAKDAYLNVVCGNVYDEKYTRQWYFKNKDDYSLNRDTLFRHRLTVNSNIIWRGWDDIEAVKKLIRNNNSIHYTTYQFTRRGGFFDQQPVKAAKGLVERKKGLSTEKYGGYNKPTATFYMLARFIIKKKRELMLVPIELLYSKRFEEDSEFAVNYIKEQIELIKGNPISDLELPLGMRKIKINTMLELDGYRATISGKTSGGKEVILSGMVPLLIGYEWEAYVKYVEKAAEKKKKYPKMVYSKKHDKITKEKNTELYDILCSKLETKLYKKRPANPVDALRGGKDKFEMLDVFEQVNCLMQIIALFSRLSGGCDLSAVGGVKKAGATTKRATMSSWSKTYSDVRIIDSSASGLYEYKSQNLLELL